MKRKYKIPDKVLLQLRLEANGMPDTEHNRELAKYLEGKYMSMNPFKRVILEDSDLVALRRKLGTDSGEVYNYHREARNFVKDALNRNQLNIQIGR